MKWLLILCLFYSCASITPYHFGEDKTVYREFTSETALEEVTQTNLKSFYENYIRDQNVSRWMAQTLPREYHLPSAGPSKKYFNNSILWALDKNEKTIFGFRPISTTTGCNSGCSPVVFHLKFDAKGNVVDLIEDPNELLRKKWHKAYTRSDKAKALELAKRIPEKLMSVLEPKYLADDLNHYPPQTWTTLKDYLVNESAYTSYRIVQASYQVKSFLSGTPQDKAKEKQYEQFITSHLNRRWRSMDQVRQSFQIIEKISNTPLSAHISGMIFTSPHNLLVTMIAYGNDEDVENVRRFLGNTVYQSTHVGAVCDLKKHLLNIKKGQEILIRMKKEPGQWPECNPSLDNLYALMAAGSLGDVANATLFSNGIDLNIIPPVVKKDADLLTTFIQLTETLNNEEAKQWAIANLKVRFPLLQNNFVGKKTLLQKAEKDYRSEIKRGMLHADIPFPQFSSKTKDGNVSTPIKGKQIYVFFATWCPHCKAKVKEWSQFSDQFWKKVALVEVFPKSTSPSRFTKFCEETNLSEQRCNEILEISSEEERRELYQTITLAGVPRIIISRKDGNVGFFDYKLNHSKGSDAKRDLEWAIEEIETTR